MKILLSHHYWKDNKNAVWYPPDSPYPQIEQQIKESYAILEVKRPPWRKYGNITVFFDYRPQKDVFGRDSVPISFAFVPDCLNPAVCRPMIAQALAKQPNTASSMELDLPATCVSQSSSTFRPGLKLKVLLGICLFVLLGISFIFLQQSERHERPAELLSSALPPAGGEMPADMGQVLVEDKAEKQEPDALPSFSNTTTEPLPSPVTKIPNDVEELCVKSVEISKALLKCPKAYFNMLCAKLGDSFPPFERWKEESGGKSCETYNSSNRVNIFGNNIGLDESTRQKLKEIFKNGYKIRKIF